MSAQTAMSAANVATSARSVVLNVRRVEVGEVWVMMNLPVWKRT